MSKDKRREIFKIYSENLLHLRAFGYVAYAAKKNRPYLCPICLDEFSEEDLDVSKPQHLTLEDAPPKSLGGQAKILTCKKCNNTCGHKIDAHLANRMKELDRTMFFRNSKSRIKSRFKDLVVNGTIEIDELGNQKMILPEGSNNPEILKKYVTTVGKDDIVHITFMPTTVNDDRLMIALLKTGYLLTFEKYGYAFILEREYDRIREQLLNPEKIIYPLDFWFLGPFPDWLTEIVPFVKELGLGSVLPFFKIKTPNSARIFATILPVNNRRVEEVIAGLRKKFEVNSDLSIEMKKFDTGNNFLTDMGKVDELLKFIRTLT